MLYGRVLRSPHAHARIKKIDASKALALPGVKAVVTAADFPRPPAARRRSRRRARRSRARFSGDNFLAGDKVLYRGHAVAAVAATDAAHRRGRARR